MCWRTWRWGRPGAGGQAHDHLHRADAAGHIETPGRDHLLSGSQPRPVFMLNFKQSSVKFASRIRGWTHWITRSGTPVREPMLSSRSSSSCAPTSS
eukprot:705620-Pyramimonas_sp.AAC.1